MGGARQVVAVSLVSVLCAGSTAWAQSPLAGNWNSLRFEDEQDRGPGPDLGDYSGLAINSAARLFADSWDASRLTLQEHQCRVHVSPYIYHGPLKRFEKPLLRSPLVPWSYFASNFYHNVYWYPFVGRPRVKAALDTKWGRLFQSYGDGRVVLPGPQPGATAVAGALAAAALGASALVARRAFTGRASGPALPQHNRPCGSARPGQPEPPTKSAESPRGWA